MTPPRDGDGDGEMVAQIIPLRRRAGPIAPPRSPDHRPREVLAPPREPPAATERSVWDQPTTELRRRPIPESVWSADAPAPGAHPQGPGGAVGAHASGSRGGRARPRRPGARRRRSPRPGRPRQPTRGRLSLKRAGAGPLHTWKRQTALDGFPSHRRRRRAPSAQHTRSAHPPCHRYTSRGQDRPGRRRVRTREHQRGRAGYRPRGFDAPFDILRGGRGRTSP